MVTRSNKDRVVEKAYAHFRGDRSVGIYPHTVTVQGLDFRREHFDDDDAGEKEFADSLDRFRLHLQEALAALHGETYKVSFDFEREAEMKEMWPYPK